MASTVVRSELVGSASPEDSVMGNGVESYRQVGFDAGYRRAANDLLADFILLATRLRSDLRSGNSDLSAERLKDLREFEQQLERAADGATVPSRTHVYVDGGLGI